jgi:undecaprenyl diphosphate synthase
MSTEGLPEHIAIVLDGNRRWAKARGLSVKEGHKAGAKSLETIAQYCNDIGIKYLTVYCFSTENWKRSTEEVSALMLLFRSYLNSFAKKTDTQNIKINVIGDPSAFDTKLQLGIKDAMERTKNNTGLVLNIALNYGGRQEITTAVKELAKKVQENKIRIEDIDEEAINNSLYTAGQPDPDLFIRTSLELRLSGFLLWQVSYSELYFTDVNWPDFTPTELNKAIESYTSRNRRFGGRPEGKEGDKKVSA